MSFYGILPPGSFERLVEQSRSFKFSASYTVLYASDSSTHSHCFYGSIKNFINTVRNLCPMFDYLAIEFASDYTSKSKHIRLSINTLSYEYIYDIDVTHFNTFDNINIQSYFTKCMLLGEWVPYEEIML